MAFVFKTVGLFIVTAIAEIVGCYLPYLWLKERVSALALIPAALSLAAFAWLLSLHPETRGLKLRSGRLIKVFCHVGVVAPPQTTWWNRRRWIEFRPVRKPRAATEGRPYGTYLVS